MSVAPSFQIRYAKSNPRCGGRFCREVRASRALETIPILGTAFGGIPVHVASWPICR